MENKQKIELADHFLNLMANFAKEETKNNPKFIGTLTKAQGIKGFKLAEIGNPVFEYQDRYIIYLESLDGKTNVTVPYFKKDLSTSINFTSNYFTEESDDEYNELINRSAELRALQGFLNDRLRNYYPKKEMSFNQKVVFALEALFRKIDIIDTF